jgi:putative transposase
LGELQLEVVMEDIRLVLSDEAWGRISRALYAVKHPAGAPPELSDRDFVEAVLYVARTSIPWRDLPACFGDWNAVYQRFRRWEKAGYWAAVFAIVPGDLSEVERLLLDSTTVRAHPHATGAPQKKEAKKPKAWGAAEEDSRANCTLPQRTRTRLSPLC